MNDRLRSTTAGGFQTFAIAFALVMLFASAPAAARAGDDDSGGSHGGGRPPFAGPGDRIVCCLPNGPGGNGGPTCKDVWDSTNCSRHGGFNRGPGSCDEGNPCGAITTTSTTSPAGTSTSTTLPTNIQCCVQSSATGAFDQCMLVTAAECDAQNGINIGAGTCAAGACPPGSTSTSTTSPAGTSTSTTSPAGTSTSTTSPAGTSTSTTSPAGTSTSTTAPTGTSTSTTAPTGTSSTTTTVVTTTTSTTTGPSCTCAGGAPSRLSFTTTIGSGTCGHLDSDTAANFFTLQCGGLYFGGAGVGVPLPSIIPDMGSSLLATTCNGSALTLSNTTSAQTGSNRNCTSAGCLFGPPLPIPNGSHLGSATSTCVINTVSKNATGMADCTTGATTGLDLPLSSGLFLTGDLLPNRCSGGPTPGKGCTATADCGAGGTCVNDTGRCRNGNSQAANTPCVQDADCTQSATCETGVCTGGSNANFGCILPADCPSGSCTTLIQPCPICNATTMKCNGGPNDGLTCTPGDSGVNGDYPTSHDCPPAPGTSIGALPIAFLLDSGTQTKTAVDFGQVDVFCGFCGNPITGTFKNPAQPCTADADCAANSLGQTKCKQRTSGAFTANDVARTIVATGSPAGPLTTGGAAQPAKVVSIFCIPPTFNPLVDSAADLPGPGMTALAGMTQLLP